MLSDDRLLHAQLLHRGRDRELAGGKPSGGDELASVGIGPLATLSIRRRQMMLLAPLSLDCPLN